MPKITKSKKQVANQLWHFSVRWSVEHNEENVEELKNTFKCFCDKWIFQAEDTTENPHYQAYVHTTEKIRPKTLAVQWNAAHRGIEVRASSTAGKLALSKYAMKQDTRVAGPWADRKIYMGKDLWPQERWPAWEQTVYRFLMEEPDDRTLNWVHDPVGSQGKTKFIKCMAFNHGFGFLSYGNAADLLNVVSKTPNKPGYLFNLTRTKPKTVSSEELYATLESVKDGMFINTKYETSEVFMDPPHIWVFSNQLPITANCTQSRWKIWTIPQLSQMSQVNL